MVRHDLKIAAKAGKDGIHHLLGSLTPESPLTPRVVSPRINSVRNNGPELIEPAEPATT
jgi:hypothetical protein